MAKCIVELEKIYRIRKGSEGKRSLDVDNSLLKTQKELSTQMVIEQEQ
ncbi:hypothetical protein [Clostridium tagluense]|nr:hypothetical protein [Clostridium tagluense]